MRDLQHQPRSAGIFFCGGLRGNVPPEESPRPLGSSCAAVDSQRTRAHGKLRKTVDGATTHSVQNHEDLPALADLVIFHEGLYLSKSK